MNEKYPIEEIVLKSITRFRGCYSFLNNMYPSSVFYDGYEYPTVEHAFQAAKCEREFTIANWCMQIQKVKSPQKAKRIGQSIKLRQDWEEVKYNIMFELVLQKFARHFDLREQLLETAGRDLIEGNDWGDTYWGVCDGEGQNQLGKILMSVRRLLMAE